MLTEQVDILVFEPPICPQDLDLAVETSLKKRKKMLKFLCCFVFGLGEKYPAVIGLVVYEIYKVAISKRSLGVTGPFKSEHMTPPILSIGEFDPLSF